jgi:hypothetical protein
VLLRFVILALATWRMTSLLVWEDGPFEMFARIRHVLGVRYDETNMAYGSNWFAKGVVCPACASVWFGTLWAVAYWLWPDVWWLALPLALSAGAILMERLNNV